MKTVCAWCGKVVKKDKDKDEDVPEERVTHGICPACKAKYLKELETAGEWCNR